MLREFLEQNPTVKILFPYLLGVILGYSLHSRVLWVLILSTGLLVLITILLPEGTIKNVLLFLIMVFAGICNISFEFSDLYSDTQKITSTSNRIVCTGKVDHFERFQHGGGKVRLREAVLISDSTCTRLSCRILLSIRKCNSQFQQGNRIVFRSKILVPPDRRNPGDFDYRKYLQVNRITGVAYLKTDSEILTIKKRGNLFDKLVSMLKGKIENAIELGLAPRNATILKALILGLRGELTEEIKNDFINAGVIHVLAVSGLHVGYIAVMVLVILSFFRFPAKLKTIIAIFALYVYSDIVGFKPSVVRAMIMADLILIARTWEFVPKIYNIIFASALIQTLINPLELFDVGFQLSYAAVISIVYFYNKFLRFLSSKFLEKVKKHKAMFYIFQLFLISLSANLGTLPISMYYFHRLPLISMVSNVIVIPLVGVIAVAGFAQVIMGVLYHGVGEIYGEVTNLLLHLLRSIINFFAELPFAYMEVAGFGLLTLLLIYFAILVGANLDNRKFRLAGVILGLVLINFVLWKGIIAEPGLEVTFLDVGQGDAIYVQFPSGKNMLVDTGDKKFRFDAGSRFIVPFLKYKGVKRINYLVLTHPHSDHVGGASTVLTELKVDTIYSAEFGSRSKLWISLCRLADSLGIPLVKLSAGDIIRISSNAVVLVLYPFQNLSSNSLSYNNLSVVLKVNYGGESILLTGDIEKPAEEYLLHWDRWLESEIVKVPHHGSNSSSSYEFVKMVHPDYAVISVGRNDKFGHPDTSVVLRYKSLGAKVLRTDIDHAAVFVVRRREIRLIDW